MAHLASSPHLFRGRTSGWTNVTFSWWQNGQYRVKTTVDHFWGFIICSIYTSRFDFWYCVSCILSVSWRNFSCQADGCLCQDCLSSLPQQALPHLAKRRSMVAGAQYSLQPIWRFVVLTFLSETFRDCYNTCLDKIIGRYCNFFCVQYLCSFGFCLYLYVLCCLHLKFCLIHILFSL